MRYEILRLEHINFKGPSQNISDISFCVYQGECLCILTEDFVTKNNLLDFFQAKAPSADGVLYIFDHQESVRNLMQAHRKGIYVVNDNQLVDSMSVAHNLYMANDAYYTAAGFQKESRMTKDAYELLKQFEIETINPSAAVNTLTVFNKYLLSILHAYANGAKLIIMDTPSESIKEPAEIKKLQRIVLLLKDKGISFLWFSYKWHPLFQEFDRFGVIKNGVVTQISKIVSIPPLMPEQMLFNSITNPDKAPVNTMEPLLQCTNIPGRLPPYREISFSLYKDEILGIYDTEHVLKQFFLTLSEAMLPPVGSVILNQKQYYPNFHLKGQIAFITEKDNSNRVFTDMNLYDNVTILLDHPMYDSFGFINNRIRNHMAKTALSSIHADYLIEKYGDKERLDSICIRDQFVIEISKWLCLHPKAFVFIEPHCIYNYLTEKNFIDILNDIKDLGISAVIISEVEETISNICTRNIII